jgi:hypothetical protein
MGKVKCPITLCGNKGLVAITCGYRWMPISD